MPTHPLQQLLDNRQLWRARQQRGNPYSANGPSRNHTGHPALDTALHSRGWPESGSTEILCPQLGIGELGLLLPALARLSAERPIAWLNPPYLPFPVFLAQQGLAADKQCLIQASSPTNQLWAAEELLRSGAFAAVLSWFDQASLQNRQLRRLHIAAREGDSWHLHFRPDSSRDQASPAPLRLALRPTGDYLHIDILKQPGGHAGQQLSIARPAALLARQTAAAEWPVYRQADTSVVHKQSLTLPSRLLPLPAGSPRPGRQPEPRPH